MKTVAPMLPVPTEPRTLPAAVARVSGKLTLISAVSGASARDERDASPHAVQGRNEARSETTHPGQIHVAYSRKLPARIAIRYKDDGRPLPPRQVGIRLCQCMKLLEEQIVRTSRRVLIRGANRMQVTRLILSFAVLLCGAAIAHADPMDVTTASYSGTGSDGGVALAATALFSFDADLHTLTITLTNSASVASVDQSESADWTLLRHDPYTNARLRSDSPQLIRCQRNHHECRRWLGLWRRPFCTRQEQRDQRLGRCE